MFYTIYTRCFLLILKIFLKNTILLKKETFQIKIVWCKVGFNGDIHFYTILLFRMFLEKFYIFEIFAYWN